MFLALLYVYQILLLQIDLIPFRNTNLLAESIKRHANFSAKSSKCMEELDKELCQSKSFFTRKKEVYRIYYDIDRNFYPFTL